MSPPIAEKCNVLVWCAQRSPTKTVGGLRTTSTTKLVSPKFFGMLQNPHASSLETLERSYFEAREGRIHCVGSPAACAKHMHLAQNKEKEMITSSFIRSPRLTLVDVII